ncbi:MAG: elongation factor G [Candidatus Omnitrophota bacterium]|jgi:elongation factor G|nr:MAG: elongation factor G [Candidatus Omnitrophota bacterium]
MKEVEVGKKRNIAVVGNHGAGKTTLIEAILYHTGAIDRLGRIDDGNTYADYLDEEKDRKITISSKLLHCSFKGYEINLIDTPGYTDFVGEILGALQAADVALLVINAQSGVEVETEKIWDYLEEYNIPRAVVVNRMDKERADFDAALDSMEKELGAQVCPVCLPWGKEDTFQGVIELVMDKALSFDEKGKITKQGPIPDDIADEVEEYRQKMIEASVMADDEMMERYLSDEKISNDEIRRGLCDGAANGTIVPIFVADAFHSVGIEALLDCFINYMPNPSVKKSFKAKKAGKDEFFEEKIKADGPGLGFVFKSMVDPFAGKISFIRVISGSLTGDTEWYNCTKGGKEKVAHILSVNGKKHNTIHQATVGDIIAITKNEGFDTNDTVSSVAGDICVAPPRYPQPPVHMALHAADKNEEDKIGTVLPKIISGDPTVKVKRDTETKETVISAAGSLQVEIIAQRMKNQFKIHVELSTPKVAYRETISNGGEGSYRHKKQSGGRGQFAEVHMRLKPLERGQHYEFLNNIFGGAIPTKFVPAVEKGVVDAMERGIVAGYPIVDICVDLFDGKFHEVDSSEMAFKIAASMCMRQVAREKCHPIILEPIQNVVVKVPEAYMGDVMGDLNSRRGRVMGMDAIKGKQLIKAQVPLAEMYKYSIDLRSITRGRGSFEMEFSHYEAVPHELMEKIIAESKVEVGEEE